MNRVVTYSLISLLTLVSAVHADRQLDPNEVQALIRQLTDTPRQYWFQQGTIRAQHLEYYAFENKVQQATETACLDGHRLRLDIRLDEEQSTEVTVSQDMARQMDQDIKMNRNRTFLWDGSKQVQYYESAEYAVISNISTQPDLCGPLTAGIIPWGHGDFTELVLLSQSPTVTERIDENGRRLILQYINRATTPDINITLVLDPAKDNAVVSYTIENDLALLRQTCNQYQAAGETWLPGSILIERFDKRSGAPVLLSYEDWQFESIDASAPDAQRFSPAFKNGTTVELRALTGNKTLLYQTCDGVDISPLLADKIRLMSAEPTTVNCATAAMQHIARRFCRQLPAQDLGTMICTQTGKTSLYGIKQSLEEAGLTCMAVRTDLATLEKMNHCATVLHLAQSNHYVLLDHVDSDGVWIIDLTNRSFYTRLNIADLKAEWNRGTALLVSDTTITPPLEARLDYLTTDEQNRILGGDSFGTYSCTEKLQEEEHILCSEPFGGFLCAGAYYAFYERYGCIEDENGGTCIGQKMLAYEYTQCVNNPLVQGICTHTNKWVSRYRRACN